VGLKVVAGRGIGNVARLVVNIDSVLPGRPQPRQAAEQA
jgi:hypothetical protein